MKSLLTLINDYKNNPNEYLSNKIWSFLLNEKNGHYFEKIDACKDENDWIEYGEYLRIKMISNNLFVATEIARNTFGGYFCFLYLIDVRDYTDEQLKEAALYSVEELFYCSYAPFFWQAVQIRYPEHAVYNHKLHAMFGGLD